MTWITRRGKKSWGSGLTLETWLTQCPGPSLSLPVHTGLLADQLPLTCEIQVPDRQLWASAHGFLPGSTVVGRVKAVSQSLFMIKALQITHLFQRQQREMQAVLQFSLSAFLASLFLSTSKCFSEGSLDIKAPYKYQARVGFASHVPNCKGSLSVQQNAISRTVQKFII